MELSMGRDYDGWTIHILSKATSGIVSSTKQPGSFAVRGFAEFHRPHAYSAGYDDITRVDVPAQDDPPLHFFDFEIARNHIFSILEDVIDRRKRR